jgi:hypothetical protein
MSFAVSGSNANHPFAYLQQLQQFSTPGSSQTGSDPLSTLLAAINQTGGGATSSANGANASATGGTSGGTAPQFGQQTLQTLLAVQANGVGAQGAGSQDDDPTNGPVASLPITAPANNGPIASLPIMSPSQDNGPPGSSTGGMTSPNAPALAPATTGTDSTTSDPTSMAGAANVLASPELLNQLFQTQSQLLSSTITQSITV